MYAFHKEFLVSGIVYPWQISMHFSSVLFSILNIQWLMHIAQSMENKVLFLCEANSFVILWMRFELKRKKEWVTSIKILHKLNTLVKLYSKVGSSLAT